MCVCVYHKENQPQEKDYTHFHLQLAQHLVNIASQNSFIASPVLKLGKLVETEDLGYL